MVDKVEKIPHELQPGRLDVVRLAQVTDCHIFADPDGCLLGLNTRDSYEAVCDRLLREEWRPDAILATGDLSQDASPESYQYLADYFKSLDIATFWLPGNHDNPETMELYLSNSRVFAAKQLLIGHWQVILLDSSVKGKVHGELADEQFQFLERCLKRYPDKHALVTLHHQPKDIGCQWLDQIGLKNAQISADIRTIISQAEPTHLHEPTLATLTRQIRKALDDRFSVETEDGSPVVEDVAIPKFSQYPSDG